MLTKMRAFVLRMKTWGEVDHVGDALAADRITIGWSHVRGLIGLQNLREVREAVCAASGDEDYRRAGHGAGNLWRFLHEMHPDDRVLVPRGDEVYLAKVTGPPGYDESTVTQDIAHSFPTDMGLDIRGTGSVQCFSSVLPHGHRAYARTLTETFAFLPSPDACSRAFAVTN